MKPESTELLLHLVRISAAVGLIAAVIVLLSTGLWPVALALVATTVIATSLA